jgi:MFS family permease
MAVNPLSTQKTNTDKIGILLWISFAICFLCNFSGGLIVTLMSVYLPVVVKDLSRQASSDELNSISTYISSLTIAGWALGRFFWRYVSDRIGRVKGLAFSVTLLGLFTSLISLTASWEMVATYRFFSGHALGGILVIAPTLLQELWPARTRAVMAGIDAVAFPIGIFSSGLVGLFVKDWHDAFLIGLLPVLVGIVCLFVMRESEDWRKSKGKPTLRDISGITENREKLLKGSVIFGTMIIGLWGMYSWIPTWVQSLLTGSTGETERGVAMMLLGAGTLFGGLVTRWVSNKLGIRRAMLLCFGGCILASVLLFALNDSFSLVTYFELLLLSLFFGTSQGLLYIYIPQLFPEKIRTKFTAICFIIGRVLTAVAIFMVGVMVTQVGGYSNALLILAGLFVAGFITVFLTNEETES